MTNPSQTNPSQQTITNVMNNILQALNSGNYGGCSSWLTGASPSSVSLYINTLIAGQSYGHGVFNNVRTAAISGGRNADGTLAGVPVNYAFTVNEQGAFFNAKTPTVGLKAYPGNTLRAQATILIHEFGHQMLALGGALDFKDDAGNEQAGRANDKLVATNCGSLITGLQ